MIMYRSFFLEARKYLIINKWLEPVRKKVCIKTTLNFLKEHIANSTNRICHVFLFL